MKKIDKKYFEKNKFFHRNSMNPVFNRIQNLKLNEGFEFLEGEWKGRYHPSPNFHMVAKRIGIKIKVSTNMKTGGYLVLRVK